MVTLQSQDFCSKYPVNLSFLRFKRETEVVGRGYHVHRFLFLSQLSGCCLLPDGSNVWLGQSQQFKRSPGDREPKRAKKMDCL